MIEKGYLFQHIKQYTLNNQRLHHRIRLLDQNWKELKYKYNTPPNTQDAQVEGHVFLKWDNNINAAWIESIAVLSLPSQHHFIPYY